MPSFLIKPLAILGFLSIYGAFFYYQGVTNTTESFKAEQSKQAEENAKKVAEIVSKTEKDTKRHYERYIHALKNKQPLPDKCQLSADFVRMRNAAAGVQSSPGP